MKRSLVRRDAAYQVRMLTQRAAVVEDVPAIARGGNGGTRCDRTLGHHFSARAMCENLRASAYTERDVSTLAFKSCETGRKPPVIIDDVAEQARCLNLFGIAMFEVHVAAAGAYAQAIERRVARDDGAVVQLHATRAAHVVEANDARAHLCEERAAVIALQRDRAASNARDD